MLVVAARSGAQVVELPPPGTEAWQALTFRGIERRTEYAIELDGGVESVRARSNCSASGLVLPLRGQDLTATPVLTWRWRVDRGLDIDDERSRKGDDFAARVYVLFEPRNLLERLRARLASAIYGRDVPGSALNFVWASRMEPGTTWENPFADSSQMIALERGSAADWRSERVDVPRLYLARFGRPAPALVGIAIMSDSDNTCQEAEARFADFALRPRERSDAS